MSTGITLCMIVKNEARFIDACLGSVKSILDQIIIVDTGSTDGTLDLIRPFDPLVIHYEWRNDFAQARNVGLERARTPWIMMMDADERIASRDLPLIVEATKRDATGFEFLWRNYGYNATIASWHTNTGEYEEGAGYPGYSQSPMFRLYRNHPLLRYEGVVHEHITWKSFPGVRVEPVPAVIHHYGRALSAKRMQEKGELYLALGYQKIEQFPDKWEPYYEIGIQLQDFDQCAESIPYLEKGLTLATEPNIKGLLNFYLAAAFKRLNLLDKALGCLDQAIDFRYECSSLRLLLANVYSAQGELTKASTQYRRALQLEPANPLALLNYGLLLRDTGDLKRAETTFMDAIKANPSFTLPAIELAALHSSSNRLEEAIELLEGVLKQDAESKRARQGLAKLFIQLSRPDDALRVLQQSQDDPVSDTLRGAAHLDRGEFDLARSILENVLKKDRTSVGARVNLAKAYAGLGDFSKATRHLTVAFQQTRDPSLLEMAKAFPRQADSSTQSGAESVLTYTQP